MSTRRFRSNDDPLIELRAALGVDGDPPLTLVVAAHPDDETVGAAGQLLRLGAKAIVLYVTDGAPPDPADARAAGFQTAVEYAAARRDEALRALALAGVPATNCSALGFGDQRASFDLAGVARAIAGELEKRFPAAVLTHPYEGGHPDHDATAFGVAAAVALLERRGSPGPPVVEFTSYHRGPAGLQSGAFLAGDSPQLERPLSEPGLVLKRAMLAAYPTQQRVLQYFAVGATERYRIAPVYDFTMPPHEGKLYYEDFNWGIDGPNWRALARTALEQLELGV